MSKTENITHFNSLVIKRVIKLKTGVTGWRIAGIWGDEDLGEGMKLGPFFQEEDFELCEKLLDELVCKYKLPMKISDVISHFTGIPIGARVKTIEGDGTVEEIKHGEFPFLIRLDSGGYAWQDKLYIISVENESTK